MSIETVLPSKHLILCYPLILMPSIIPSIRVFTNESALRLRWPKYWSFSFSNSHSNEYSGLISFRTDWFDLLAVQEILKSLLQHHNSEASILWRWAFLMVQLSHPYIIAGKTVALTIQAFVGKVMSLLFNAPSRIAITLISGLQNYTVTLEPKKIKSVTVPTVFHLFAMKWWDQMPWFSILNAEF